jgi:hypothetical protein
VSSFGYLVAVLWVTGFAYLAWRLYRRRGHVGPAAVGAFYEMLDTDKRQAVEVVVEERTGERDEEHADDKDPEDLAST